MLQLIFDLRLILSPSPMRQRKLWINFNLKSNLTWNKYTCTWKICTSGSLSRNYRLNWEELTSIGWLFVRYNKSGRPEDWNAAFRLIFLSFQTGMFETGNLPLIRFILPELLVMNFRKMTVSRPSKYKVLNEHPPPQKSPTVSFTNTQLIELRQWSKVRFILTYRASIHLHKCWRTYNVAHSTTPHLL